MGKTSNLYHLLIKGEFRVYCRPDAVPGDFNITSSIGKANCANCLTAYRRAIGGKKTKFRVAHTVR